MDTKDTIVLKLENAFKKLGDELYEGMYHLEEVKEDDNTISVTYFIPANADVFFIMFMKKQNGNYETIPKIKNEIEFDSSKNPYKLLSEGGNIRNFSDKQYILSQLYEEFKNENFDEMACYEKYGILIRNPFDLNGLYNISVKIYEKEG